MREQAPHAPPKVHSDDPERFAICIKAKKVRYGREHIPAWVYLYDDGTTVTVPIETR